MIKDKLDAAGAAALRQLDSHLNPLWALGRNAILAWTPLPTGLRIIVLPVTELLRQVARHGGGLLRGPRHIDGERFQRIAQQVGCEPLEIIAPLRIGPHKTQVPWETVERLIRRYSISETSHRAVVLFDIVGFSKAEPIRQIGQLNALEYAITIAHQRTRTLGIDVDVARSTTGDGFYIWNRRLGLMADAYLFLLTLLILGEVHVARSVDRDGLIPVLRTAFSIGRHYAYHQIEGLSPRGYDYIVGEVTISLARLMTRTAPHQILLGDFERPLHDHGRDQVSSAGFIERAGRIVNQVRGLRIDDCAVTAIRLDIGASAGGGPAPIRFTDKHGLPHLAHNVQAVIDRKGLPILLGIPPSDWQA